MDPMQVRDMITANRRYIQLKSNIALQNLAMLHRRFDAMEDTACRMGLALNDSMAALIFHSDHQRCADISARILTDYATSGEELLLAQHEALMGRCYTIYHRHAEGRSYLLRAEARISALYADEETRGLTADILHDLAMNNQLAGGDTEQSMTYLDHALGVLEPTEYKSRKGVCLMGKGNVRFQMERAEDALGQYLKAERFFAGPENKLNLASVFCNIGLCYMNLDRFDDAGPYLYRSLDLRTQIGSYWDIANSYYNIAMYHRMKNDVHEAYEALLSGRDYAFIGAARHLQIPILSALTELATAMGRTADAQRHHKELQGISES